MIPFRECGLDGKVQNSIGAIFAKHQEIEMALLYGSRAKGNFKNGSDIDITLVAPKMDLSELLKIENELDDLLLPYKIDLSLKHQIDNPDLIDHINRVAKVLYSK